MDISLAVGPNDYGRITTRVTCVPLESAGVAGEASCPSAEESGMPWVRVYYKDGMVWTASQPYAPIVQRNVVWSMRGKTD